MTHTTDWDRELELAMARHLRHAHRRMDDAARRIMPPTAPPPPVRTAAVAIGEALGGIQASLVAAMRDMAVGFERAARRRDYTLVGHMDQPGPHQRLRRY